MTSQASAGLVLLVLFASAARAQPRDAGGLEARGEAAKKNVLTLKPQTRAARVDHERLTVRRIDVVDETGTIRLTLSAPTPPPIVDGVQYKRAFPVSGVTYYDAKGNERGGFGVADIPGSAVVVASDHEHVDAVGWRVMPDGAVEISVNQKPKIERAPSLENHILPARGAATRLRLAVAADGTPTVSVADEMSQPRVRLTVTQEGYGAIEFLDAKGHVVQRLAPEADRTTK